MTPGDGRFRVLPQLIIESILALKKCVAICARPARIRFHVVVKRLDVASRGECFVSFGIKKQRDDVIVITPFIDFCLNEIDHLKTEAI